MVFLLFLPVSRMSREMKRSFMWPSVRLKRSMPDARLHTTREGTVMAHAVASQSVEREWSWRLLTYPTSSLPMDLPTMFYKGTMAAHQAVTCMGGVDTTRSGRYLPTSFPLLPLLTFPGWTNSR